MQDQFPHLQGLQTTLLDGIVSISESGGFLAESKNNIYVLCTSFHCKLTWILSYSILESFLVRIIVVLVLETI